MDQITWNPNGNTHSPGPDTSQNYTVAAGEVKTFNLRTPAAIGLKCGINLQSGGGDECMHAITIDGHTWSKSHTPAAALITGDTIPGGPGMAPKFYGLKPDADYVVTVTTEGTLGPYKWHINCNKAN